MTQSPPQHSPEDWEQTYDTRLYEIMTATGPTLHLVIFRHDYQEISTPWSVLQQIKDAILGPDILAIEVYPAQDRLIDEVNYRHLWVLNTPLPFGLHPLDKT